MLLRALARRHPHRHLRRIQRRRCARLPPKQLRLPTCCACSHFFSRLQLCRVRFYCIPVYDYVLLTIRVSRRLTAVDKRRFKVRLLFASTGQLPRRAGTAPTRAAPLPLLLPAAALLRALLVHLVLRILVAHHPHLAQVNGGRQAPHQGAPLLRQPARLAYSPAWFGAGLPALARCSHTPGRQPGAQTYTPLPGTPKRR